MSFKKGTLDLFKEKKRNPWTQERVLKEFKLDSGNQFSFKNYEYWQHIYEYKSELKVFQCSRQVGKTTFILNKMMSKALERDNSKIVLLVPEKKHADTIVGLMDRRIQHSPSIKSLIGGKANKKDKKKKDTAEVKQFHNGSQFDIVILESSPDGVLGKTAEFLFFDETQLIPEEHIPVALEVAQTFPNPEIVYAGNPRSPANHLNKLYIQGKQYEWIIPCPRCKKNLVPLSIMNLDPNVEAVICRDCKKILDVTQGHWEDQNPSAKYPSWHISALMNPNNAFRTQGRTGILDKMEDYQPDKFITNVMGLPTELGDAVITEAELRGCCEQDAVFITGSEELKKLRGRNLIMTIDWSYNVKHKYNATTIAALWVFHNTGRLQCVWVKRFVGPKYHDPDSVLKKIASVEMLSGVDFICTDFFIGHKENLRLRKRLKGAETQVFEIQYAGSLPYLKYFKEENVHRIGKTRSISTTIHAVKEKKFMFPPWEQSEPYLKDLLNVYLEEGTNENLIYDHIGPDDFLDCVNYALHGYIRRWGGI